MANAESDLGMLYSMRSLLMLHELLDNAQYLSPAKYYYRSLRVVVIPHCHDAKSMTLRGNDSHICPFDDTLVVHSPIATATSACSAFRPTSIFF